MEIGKTEPMDASRLNGKEPYEPPKATLVRMKMEERLLSCAKVVVCCIGGFNSSS